MQTRSVFLPCLPMLLLTGACLAQAPAAPEVSTLKATTPLSVPSVPTVVRNSRVRALSTGPMGRLQSLYLSDGLVVELPPDLSQQLTSRVHRGTRLRITGVKDERFGQPQLLAGAAEVDGHQFVSALSAGGAFPGGPGDPPPDGPSLGGPPPDGSGPGGPPPARAHRPGPVPSGPGPDGPGVAGSRGFAPPPGPGPNPGAPPPPPLMGRLTPPPPCGVASHSGEGAPSIHPGPAKGHSPAQPSQPSASPE